MKKTILLMLGLVAGTASFAQQTVASLSTAPTPQVSITADQKLKLTVSQQTAVATVTLLDEAGHQLYVERVKLHNGLAQQFDLSNLTNGKYHLLFTTGSETVSRTFYVAEQPTLKQVYIEPV